MKSNSMNTEIKSAQQRAIRTKQEWRELRQLANEYGVNICHGGNFMVMREILKHRSPKPNNMIGILFQWYNELPDWKKTVVATIIGAASIAVLAIGKQLNYF